MSGHPIAGYSEHDRERWVAEDPAQKRGDRDDFARDRARLVHSAALRRMAAKTQVMQPGTDDFIRNRLTHSLEVAQIGREFGAVLGCNPDLVDTACLAHDLGHPPFGHNGERALDELCAHIGGFEGNAQTLRILTRLEAKRAHADGRPAGLNLTRASLDAAIKYPWGRGEHPSGTAKFGVYDDDREVFAFVRSPGVPLGARCLEAQVMDWSDDVAYGVHDVEDGIASGRIDPAGIQAPAEVSGLVALAREWYAPALAPTALEAAWGRLLGSGWIPASYDGTRAAAAALKDMTSRLIGRLVSAVEEATREAHGPGQLTRYNADLVVPEQVLAEVTMLKALAARHVMLSEERAAVMADERDVIAFLVRRYVERPELLDPDFAEDARQASGDDALLRIVIDQVASLSDARALTIWGEARVVGDACAGPPGA